MKIVLIGCSLFSALIYYNLRRLKDIKIVGIVTKQHRKPGHDDFQDLSVIAPMETPRSFDIDTEWIVEKQPDYARCPELGQVFQG